ncbi:MAG: class I SAM-dependent methyltransferase [Actinomycetota bacterium]
MIARREALRPFRGERWPVRAHVALRWATSPVAEVVESVPEGGHLLEVGCGHGLYGLAALRDRIDRLTGVDPDERKIAVARRAAADSDATFRVGSVDVVDASESFDAVLVVDVLYLIPEMEQRAWLEAVAERVAPGGVLVIKEMRTDRRLKLAWTRAQEWAATRVVRVTEGGREGFRFRSPSEIENWLEELGFGVDARSLDRWSPWPHQLVVARRSGSRPEPDRSEPVEERR